MNFITVIAIPLFVGVLINLFSTIIINKSSLKDKSVLSFKNNSDNTLDNSTYQDNSTKIDNSLTQNNYSTKTTNITNYNNSTASTHSSGEEIIIVGLLTLVISILVILQNYIPIFIGFSSLMILLLLSSRKINHGIHKMSPDVNMILALQSQLKVINFKLVISIVFFVNFKFKLATTGNSFV